MQHIITICGTKAFIFTKGNLERKTVSFLIYNGGSYITKPDRIATVIRYIIYLIYTTVASTLYIYIQIACINIDFYHWHNAKYF